MVEEFPYREEITSDLILFGLARIGLIDNEKMHPISTLPLDNLRVITQKIVDKYTTRSVSLGCVPDRYNLYCEKVHSQIPVMLNIPFRWTYWNTIVNHRTIFIFNTMTRHDELWTQLLMIFSFKLCSSVMSDCIFHKDHSGLFTRWPTEKISICRWAYLQSIQIFITQNRKKDWCPRFCCQKQH